MADFTTSGTEVTVPAGLLQRGAMYAAVIIACKDDVVLNGPYRGGTVGNSAAASTKLFTR